jgi:hypothetical protein
LIFQLLTSPDTSADLKAGLKRFINFIFLPGAKNIATNEAEIGRPAAMLLSALRSMDQITDAQIEEFYALDGGRLYPGGVTTEQVAAEFVAEAQLSTMRAAWSTHMADKFVGSCQISDVADLDAFIAGLIDLVADLESE